MSDTVAAGRSTHVVSAPSVEIDVSAFYELSVPLTGFSQVELRGTGVGEQYAYFIANTAGVALFNDLLAAFRAIPPDRVDWGIRTQILGDPIFGPLARNILTLWYTGQWNAMTPQQTTQVLSPQSYQEALVWDAGGIHPTGAKQTGYGSWALPPEERLLPRGGRR
jgi:hypothetical protein